MTDTFNQQLEQERRQAAIDIAVLKRDVVYLTTTVDSLQEKMDAMEAKQDAMLTLLNEAKGGWRTMLWIGGAFTGLASFFMWLADRLGKG